MGLSDPRLEMSAEELHLLRDLFSQASGFLLREDLKFIAERRLAPRLELLGLRDFTGYARYLRFDARGPEGPWSVSRPRGAPRERSHEPPSTPGWTRRTAASRPGYWEARRDGPFDPA